MEYMAAAQGTFDDQKPSLFELLSEQQLASLIPPSLRYLLVVATHRNPRYLLPILNSFDELYAVLTVLVEGYYLRTHGGGFTENFYGLKRERALRHELPRAQAGAAGRVRETLRLTDADVWRNLLVMAGLPYLKRKLDASYEADAPRALLGAGYTRLPAQATARQRAAHCCRWLLRHVYPGVHAACHLAAVACGLAYLSGNSRYHSPLLWLVGTRVRRLGAADHRAIALLGAAAPARAPAAAASVFHPRAAYPRLLAGLKLLLPASIFALKFLEWWHASDFARQLSRRASEGLELPPPLVSGLSRLSRRLGPERESRQRGQTKRKNEEEEEEGPKASEKSSGAPESPPIAARSLLPILTVPRPADSSLCPICEGEVQTATACQTGFVFCYTCIHKWVDGSHEKQETFMTERVGKWESGKDRCAVTGRRVLGGTEGLRRVMV